MEGISQLDPRWAHVTVGKTNATLGRIGCTTTALCDLSHKLDPNSTITPAQAAKAWSYTADALILWTATQFESLTFLKRNYMANWTEIEDYAKADDRGLIIEVNHSHWLAVRGISDAGKIVVMDPIDGNVYEGLPSKYSITGYATFKSAAKKIEVSPYAKKAVDRATELKIATEWANPREIVCNAAAEAIFMRTGLLERKTAQGGVTKEDLVYLLHRINAFK